MEETYRIKAIILSRQPFRENDAKVTVYSAETGKQSLVARGAKKFRSKLAAHLEPLCFSEIMVVRGKAYDYVGSVIAAECFIKLKNDLEKLAAAGEVLRIFNKLIKEGEAEAEIFRLLYDFLSAVNQGDDSATSGLLSDFFILKLFSSLGYRPELHNCIVCGQKLQPAGNRFDFLKSGLVCNKCQADKTALTVSDNCIKVLRIALDNDFEKLNKLKISKAVKAEVSAVVKSVANHS